MTPKEKIEALYKGIGFFYPTLIYGPDASSSNENKIEFEGKILSKKEFLNIVFEFTKTNDINLALKKLLALRENVDEIKPEEQPDRTTPENLEELVEEREKQKEKSDLEKEKARAKKAKGRAQRPAKTEQKAEQIKKVIYAEPKDTTQKVQATPEDEYALKRLTESAIKDQKVFVEKLSEEIVKNASLEIKKIIPPEQLELSAKQIALDFSERLVYKTPVAPPGVFASIADPAANLEKIIASPPAVEQIREAGVIFSALSERSDFTTRTLLYPVLGEKVTGLVYGPAQATYIATLEPTDNTAYTVNLSELRDNATDFQSSPIYQSLNNPLVDIAKEKLISFGKDTFISQLNKLPKEGALGFISRFSSSGTFDSTISLLARSQTQYAATNIVGKFVTTFLPQYTEIIGGVANFLKLNIGLAPVVAGAVPTAAITAGTTKQVATIAGGAIGKVITAAAVKLGLSATLSATLGTALPIIGHAIGFILGFLAQKLIGWLKKNPDIAIGIGAAVLIGGLLIQSPVLIIGGAAALAVGGLAGGALTAGAVAGGILLFGRRLGKSLAITVGLPIIIMIAVTPIIVYFILFIINSGAYIVPAGMSSIIPENPYIGVEKKANPPGPFENSNLPIHIAYTITVKAKKGALTNIRFKHVCEVITQAGRSSCPAPLPSSVPATISPSTPFVFTYDVDYSGDQYKDSLVLNTFTVIADASEGKNQESGASATVIIGDPPTGCFKLIGTNWPANFRSNLEGVIVKLSTDHPVYVAKVCSGGEIGVAFDPTPHTYWGYHNHAGDIDITLYSGGLSSQLNAEYILTHESGHHLSAIMSSLYSLYKNSCSACANERPICSYGATSEPSEAFAEMIALYGSEKPLSQFLGCSGGGTFKEKYPAHWQFANDNVFR